MSHAPGSLVAAIDQGTTSSRCILFDHDGRPVASHQLEHRQIIDELRSMDRADRRWEPSMDEAARRAGVSRWHKGVERSLGWVESGT
jgi:glycerol kinase